MAILIKNPNEEIFIEGLNYCIDNSYLTDSDKELAIQAGGISTEQWESIVYVIREGWGLSFAGRLIQIKLDEKLVHPDFSNFKQS